MSGRYALFIWGSYALTALVLLWNVFAPRLARAAVLRRIADGGASGDDEAGR